MEDIYSLLAKIVSWLNIFTLMPPLYAATVSIIIGAIIIWSFKRLYRKEKESAKKAELDLHITKGNWPKDTKESARDRLKKRSKKQLVSFGLWIIAFVILFLVFSIINSYLDANNRTTIQENISYIDKAKQSLKRKTIRNPIRTVCIDGPIKDIERVRSEKICELEAAGNTSGMFVNVKTYQLCMMKRGWFVRECQEGEKDCVALRTGSGCCDEVLLKTKPEYRSIQCLETPEEGMIMRWESICRDKAYIEGIDKAMHMETFKITAIIRTYDACMGEQGWLTQECTPTEQDCVELPYIEGACTGKIRDWLEGNVSSFDSFLISCNKKRYEQLLQ